MRVNKEELARLAQKSDAELWGEIQSIASKYGYALPKEIPPREKMEKIRAALTGVERLNLSDAAKILNAYKKK